MNKIAFYHHANSEYSYIDGDKITLLFRAAKGDLSAVSVIEYNRFTDYRLRKNRKMELYQSDELFDFFKVTFVPENYGCIYYFKLFDGEEIGYYGEFGYTQTEFIRLGSYEIPRIQPTDSYHSPEWVNEAVFYQIYPDRFDNFENTTGTYEPWGTQPTFWNVFGGNFKGILRRIPHLVELGINAIYMTPISLSHSSHRYDTIDYMQIDPRLGTDEEFAELVQELHRNGIKIVLDAVFNHSSNEFKPFMDVLENQENSRYKDWFLIDQFPIKVEKNKTYQTFASEPHMPKLNSLNSEVRDYLIKVGLHYIQKFDIDGWRLDVADEVDSEFWRAFRRAIKTAKPSALIIGEVWHNSDYYLRGDQFDSVQNYQFYEVINNFFLRKSIDLKTFKNQVVHLLTMYPEPVLRALLNQMDSHDVARTLTVAKNDIKSLKLAILFQLTYIGMPCIYYGSEIGMEGSWDPDNRRCFDWNKEHWNLDLFNHYHELIALRKHSSSLKNGSFKLIETADILVYDRVFGTEITRIMMNPSNQDQPFDLGLTIGFSGLHGKPVLPAKGYLILQSK